MSRTQAKTWALLVNLVRGEARISIAIAIAKAIAVGCRHVETRTVGANESLLG